MSKLIIANCKMNFTLNEAKDYCSKFINSFYVNKLIIASPTPYLAYLAEKFPSLSFSSQIVSKYNNFGSYTGEHSAMMLASSNIKYCLIGHNERRKEFGENDVSINKQIVNCLDHNLIPIICIGETLEEKMQNNQSTVIVKQLDRILPQNIIKEFIIAYEPIWAIGTGHTPQMEDLTNIFKVLSNFLEYRGVAMKASLVYGGSVDLKNIEIILALPNIHGALIGKSCLNAEVLIKMLNIKF